MTKDLIIASGTHLIPSHTVTVEKGDLGGWVITPAEDGATPLFAGSKAKALAAYPTHVPWKVRADETLYLVPRPVHTVTLPQEEEAEPVAQEEEAEPVAQEEEAEPVAQEEDKPKPARKPRAKKAPAAK